ncbi:hypothetical protein, partial [Primorskyibacter sp. 2E233]|uniref:hypothetical protein n=1 Tax=Primorskyibacter sp. 2E233 TaxID=3413431 RepID=UPI003BF3D937
MAHQWHDAFEQFKPVCETHRQGDTVQRQDIAVCEVKNDAARAINTGELIHNLGFGQAIGANPWHPAAGQLVVCDISGPILLKNSPLIEGASADSIPALDGRI